MTNENIPYALQIGRRVFLCTSCKERFRVDRFVPHTTLESVQYCVVCGAKTLQLTEPAHENWLESIANDLEMPLATGIPLLKALHAMWDPISGDLPSFVDFVVEQMLDAESEVESEHST